VIIPDLNLLVYAYNASAPHHASSRQWWEDTVGGHQPIGIPWVVALGFLRILTSRVVMDQPMEGSRALAHLGSWFEQPSVSLLQPGPRHLAILTGFSEAGALSSALVTDAHLAALAIEHQAVVHSNDCDFSRFPGLRWHNPLP
jgi:toxin-antitoxin system PIN domain toxin